MTLELDDATRTLVDAARKTGEPDAALRAKLIACLDYTRLDDTIEEAALDAMAARAAAAKVAAICIPPAWVARAKQALAGSKVAIATVVNFPGGEDGPETVHDVTVAAVRDGADEIDVVFPYKRFLADTAPPASRTLRTCRDACGMDVRIKVILETGAFHSTEALQRAAAVAIDGGADFLKTSTGKIQQGATLEAAAVLLAQIEASGFPVGFKASGGVRTPQDAASYFTLAESMLGKGWATPDRFRIGASALLDALT
ncbi:deoxyribose-phosphate aldolase [Roseiterribacter gracilis]|uniref:Deoxyribose-phosphate aldolase n=1 Tax=Roseiterribacter gracilis TaxID=2812848 RepID=A0A8S8X8C3_9PROT|nr:deoxyribose-phosphate aldolase [Rhodospirillales bacterium TMPK1]